MNCIEIFTVIIESLNFVAIVVGGVFALYKWHQNNNIKKCEFVDKLVDKSRKDPMIVEGIYTIDYENNFYNNNFHNSKLENVIDSTLSFYSYICYLKSMKRLGKKEFAFFEYALQRIGKNESIIAYFYNLYNFSERKEQEFAFKYLLDYFLKNRFFSKEDISQNNPRGFDKFLSF